MPCIFSRSERTKEVPVLEGETMDSPEQLKEAFKKGYFQYQFTTTCRRTSRIMRCSDEDELSWLITQVIAGAKVVVQVGHF
jgi:hypothetical protein